MLTPAVCGVRFPLFLAVLLAFSVLDASKSCGQQTGDAKPAVAVSYYRSVRPILQRNCSGCHFAGKREWLIC
jgi:hypothetical protein